MIDTIVFDIGNVLVHFGWKEYFLSRGFYGEAFEKIVHATVKNPVWNTFDTGLLSTEEAITLFAKEAPEYKKQIAEIYDNLPDMLPIYDYTWNWISTLKEQGYRIYALSNWSAPAYHALLDTSLSFLSQMDGAVISFQEGIIKPNPVIYKRLCDRYDILPSKAVFLDDTAANILTAHTLGFHTVHFENYVQASSQLNSYLASE